MYKNLIIEKKECIYTFFFSIINDEIQKAFGFSAKNAEYEVCYNGDDIDEVYISLNNIGYDQYLFLKNRIDKIKGFLIKTNK